VNLSESEARSRLARARVARLATADASGRPHLVPVTFAVDFTGSTGGGAAADLIYIAIDHKPKTTTSLKRLRNIQENPAVSLLADHYEDDWAALWWVRVDGQAVVVPAGAAERQRPLGVLAEKYPQYREYRPDGPLIVIAVSRWTGWTSTPPAGLRFRAPVPVQVGERVAHLGRQVLRREAAR
jgi:PPOX class probable F420-dependent enzyme